MDYDDANDMDEIIPNLWVGDINSARDTDTLRQKGIYSVLSAMRGKVSVHETFTRHQVELDDDEGADALGFFPQCIAFIQAELDKGRGVLVHCLAGQSRSATIVAAYLMYSKNLDVRGALEILQKARPSIYPNEGFLIQLDIFHEASYKVSKKDKVIRMFYLEKAINEVLNGDGTSELPTDMFAKFPRTPTDSTPNTPIGFHRRIRCKMCRQELATREHMMDHGQVGPATPATLFALSPANSRRPSMNQHQSHPLFAPASRRASANAPERPNFSAAAMGLSMTAITSAGGSGSRRPSLTLNERPLTSSMARRLSNPHPEAPAMRRASASLPSGQSRSHLGSFAGDTRPKQSSLLSESMTYESMMSESALDDDDDEEDMPSKNTESTGQLDDDDDETSTAPTTSIGLLSPSAMSPISPTMQEAVREVITEDPIREEHEDTQMRDNTLPTSSSSGLDSHSKLNTMQPPASLPPQMPHNASSKGGPYFSPQDLTAQLNSHPKLAALKSPFAGVGGLGGIQPMTKMNNSSNPGNLSSVASPVSAGARETTPVVVQSPPLLVNPKCSGYFVEPMKWMEPFLDTGKMAGKIICPNTKCGAKLGNYDWAGVCCSCKEWVVPGFCIHRSKVDEFV